MSSAGLEPDNNDTNAFNHSTWKFSWLVDECKKRASLAVATMFGVINSFKQFQQLLTPLGRGNCQCCSAGVTTSALTFFIPIFRMHGRLPFEFSHDVFLQWCVSSLKTVSIEVMHLYCALGVGACLFASVQTGRCAVFSVSDISLIRQQGSVPQTCRFGSLQKDANGLEAALKWFGTGGA